MTSSETSSSKISSSEMTGFGNVQFGNVAVSKIWMLAKSVVLTYLNNGRQISILEGKLISAKVISYHFWSNRARTLLTSPFASKLLPLRAGHLSTLPQGHASIPGQIRWFTGPSPLSFLFALPMSHAISPFWLYTGETTFLGKSTHFLNRNRSDFLRCTSGQNYLSNHVWFVGVSCIVSSH